MTPVEDYIHTHPIELQSSLKDLRNTILRAVPGISESISYGMPAYKWKGKPLLYFGAFKNHIGLYATPQGHQAFSEELSKYKQGKGSVQFPLDQPIPLDLIKRIVLFRKEQIEKGRGE
ncbi:MAG: DUF1801 domain-containing protein [Bacteroidota bacterium]|nr:DUF1801 domain-containing protein [Bacteroidota bacterium]MDX5505333.1 DUF1801 domain-containing protein [Bacteroidota bacterium]